MVISDDYTESLIILCVIIFFQIIGYFSDSPPQIMSGAVAALSLLLYKDADLCLSVHDFLPSILALLKRKDPDVIKVGASFN